MMTKVEVRCSRYTETDVETVINVNFHCLQCYVIEITRREAIGA